MVYAGMAQPHVTKSRQVLHDRDIREPLFDFLEERYGKVRILEEKQMGRSRADIVMVWERAVVGVEIKSDADTYVRLARQVKDYDQYFDRNYVVVGTSHAMHIREHVPDWWGVITVELEDGAPDFYVLREASENPGVDLKKKLSLLWRPELAHLQEKNEMPRYEERSKVFVIGKLAERVSADVLSGQISEELLERDYTEIAQSIEAYRKEKGRGTGRKKSTAIVTRRRRSEKSSGLHTKRTGSRKRT